MDGIEDSTASLPRGGGGRKPGGGAGRWRRAMADGSGDGIDGKAEVSLKAGMLLLIRALPARQAAPSAK